MIPEAFLHYVWRTRHFDHHELTTADGKKVVIKAPGKWNHDQGPDFSEATIEIDGIEWHGQVEIHVNSKDWYRHGHQQDQYYNHTILHVVYHSDDEKIIRQDGSRIPELELQGRIPANLLTRFRRLENNEFQIPCQSLIATVPTLHRQLWITRMAISRVEEKAECIYREHQQQKQDWNQTIWEEMMAVMGGTVNKDAFRQIARSVSFKIIHRYKDNIPAMEALLFGVSRILNGKKSFGTYHQALREEWQFLAGKHQLEAYEHIQIRYMRMRPASFPTIRLAQMVQILHLFPQLTDLIDPQGFRTFQETPVGVSEYWNHHYRFHDHSKKKKKYLGKPTRDLLMINAIIPIAWLYHRAHGRENLDELIENGLDQISPEKNKITRIFSDLGIHNENALDSQGIIHLKRNYCDQKRCLECGIGNQILKGG